jgi:ammonia channel protein AmtB
VNAVRSIRVSREVELEGLDLPQFGMEAYPQGDEQVSLA